MSRVIHALLMIRTMLTTQTILARKANNQRMIRRKNQMTNYHPSKKTIPMSSDIHTLELPVIHYHEIMIIYPYPFWW